MFTPSDNDWTDCDRPSNGGFNSRERLDRERSCSCSCLCLCSNLCDTAPDPAEFAARNAANIKWMQETFAAARARDARDANLRLLGTMGPTDRAGARGYILTRGADMKAGRPVCFVFTGEADEDDGSAVFLRSDRVRQSVNFQLLEAGMAYPLFYETIFKELRDELLVALSAGIIEHAGYLRLDRSMAGVAYTGPHRLGDLPPIFPKLFRRLDEWNGATLKGFLVWLDQSDDERVHTLSDHRFIGFQDVVEVSGNTVRLLYPPQDLVFRPKPFGPSAH